MGASCSSPARSAPARPSIHALPVRLREMPGSVRRFFWPLMSLLFVIWIALLLAGPLIDQSENAGVIWLVVWLALPRISGPWWTGSSR